VTGAKRLPARPTFEQLEAEQEGLATHAGQINGIEPAWMKDVRCRRNSPAARQARTTKRKASDIRRRCSPRVA